ncbi:MAG TPA: NAD(P)/FAD-dependent oxidoreductase [Candidatus Kapabacteria bacterium]
MRRYIGAMYDVIIIGSGLGGLFSAALIKNAFPSLSILVLEGHTVPGGCASYYDRFIRVGDSEEKIRFRFDVGATTLSGIEEGQSVRQLLDTLKISIRSKHCEIGTHIVLSDGTRINRFADRDKWHRESARIFGNKTVAFWLEIEQLASKAWSVSGKYPFFPFIDLKDVLRTASTLKIEDIAITAKSQQSMWSLLAKHGLTCNTKFIAFLDEQLLISLQCKTQEAPLLLAALALDYPSETYYIEGGMYTVAERVAERFVELGGEIRYKEYVKSITYSIQDTNYSLVTKKESAFQAKHIISNATIWNTYSMLDDSLRNVRDYLSKDIVRIPDTIWGGLDIYGVIGDSVDDKGALYHQLHGDGYSVFLSLSDRDDRLKAPLGYRVFSCSTHERNPKSWFGLGKEEYDKKRQEAFERVEAPLYKYLDGYTNAKKLLIEFATPSSYEFYTRRSFGRVGGIPHTRSRKLWQWRSNATPQKGLYMVGDTVFPGQGTPALAQCALNLLERFKRDLL